MNVAKKILRKYCEMAASFFSCSTHALDVADDLDRTRCLLLSRRIYVSPLENDQWGGAVSAPKTDGSDGSIGTISDMQSWESAINLYRARSCSRTTRRSTGG